MTAATVYPGLDKNPALRRLRRIYKTNQGIADVGGVTQQAVSLWMSGKRRPGGDSCIRIERATKGKVSVRDLRPDLFGR